MFRSVTSCCVALRRDASCSFAMRSDELRCIALHCYVTLHYVMYFVKDEAFSKEDIVKYMCISAMKLYQTDYQ